MARPKDPKLERARRQRLQRQTVSRLSIPEFCAREGVSCSSFYAWKRRLTAPALPARPDPRDFPRENGFCDEPGMGHLRP